MTTAATDAPPPLPPPRSPSPPPVLAARGLAVGYGRRRPVAVLEGIDLEARPGELIALLGRNGAGKSTLLRTLAGLQRPLAGSVEIGGRPLADLSPGEIARRLSVVLTDRIDAAQLTAGDIVGFGRAPHAGFSGRLSAADAAVVQRAFSAVSAAHLADRRLDSLSDGERQRVMIARALAQEPRVMLLDEPTAFLDAPARIETARLLRRLARDGGLAIIVATHDFDAALRHCDRIWLLRPDRIIAVGAPEDLAFNGEIAAAFGGGQIEFDSSAMTFEPAPDGADALRASVSGEGKAAALARLALRRAGCAPADGEDAPLRVRIEESEGGVKWDAHGPGGISAEGRSLGDLSAHARYACTVVAR